MSEASAALLGLISGEPPDLSSVYDFIEHVLDSSEMRERCAVLSSMTSHLDEVRRLDDATALAIMLVCEHSPRQRPGSEEYFRVALPRYVALAAPLPSSPWSGHTRAAYGKSKVPEWVTVSPHLAAAVMAFEDLMGVPGTLIKRG